MPITTPMPAQCQGIANILLTSMLFPTNRSQIALSGSSLLQNQFLFVDIGALQKPLLSTTYLLNYRVKNKTEDGLNRDTDHDLH